MTHKELNTFINLYLSCFNDRQYVQELQFTSIRLKRAQHTLVLDKMEKFDLIKPNNRMNGKEWELTTFGHEVLKFGSWRRYLVVKQIKGLVTFLGGLWTIIGTIAAIFFGYLTIAKDNELDSQKKINIQLTNQIDSLTTVLKLKKEATSVTSYSQTDTTNIRLFVTNKVENDNWFDNLVTFDKKAQIEKIKQRLLADTVALTTDSTWTVKSIQPLTIEHFCRPLIRINEDTIIIETVKQTKEFISILNDTKFNKIETLNVDKAKGRYGKWGLCGVIHLTTRDEKITDKIKEIGL